MSGSHLVAEKKVKGFKHLNLTYNSGGTIGQTLLIITKYKLLISRMLLHDFNESYVTSVLNESCMA